MTHLGKSPHWRQYSLSSVLQPIVNLKDRDIVGVEALARGYDNAGATCDPLSLFAEAAQQRDILSLDRQCREAAFAAYEAAGPGRPDVLFVNLTSSLLDDPSSSDNYLLEQVHAWGIRPDRVAIEVVESGVRSMDTLRSFAERYRRHGFLIALDDFGASHSNLERLVELKPDVVKIDRNLVSGVHENHYKRAVVEAISGLCHSFGAISLAEGVEHSAELECLTSLGCDLFQGYLLARPIQDFASERDRARETVRFHATQAGSRVAENALLEYEHTKAIVRTGQDVADQLHQMVGDDSELASVIASLPDVQCAYLTDLGGEQITGTIFNPSTEVRERALFRPAERGADHGLKDYVYHIRTHGAPHYLTGPYLSRATGTLCRTLSLHTYTRSDTPVILCLDIVQQQ
ncbi:MAG: EAL domain-containing protein [bacterium]